MPWTNLHDQIGTSKAKNLPSMPEGQSFHEKRYQFKTSNHMTDSCTKCDYIIRKHNYQVIRKTNITSSIPEATYSNCANRSTPWKESLLHQQLLILIQLPPAIGKDWAYASTSIIIQLHKWYCLCVFWEWVSISLRILQMSWLQIKKLKSKEVPVK